MRAAGSRPARHVGLRPGAYAVQLAARVRHGGVRGVELRSRTRSRGAMRAGAPASAARRPGRGRPGSPPAASPRRRPSPVLPGAGTQEHVLGLGGHVFAQQLAARARTRPVASTTGASSDSSVRRRALDRVTRPLRGGDERGRQALRIEASSADQRVAGGALRDRRWRLEPADVSVEALEEAPAAALIALRALGGSARTRGGAR